MVALGTPLGTWLGTSLGVPLGNDYEAELAQLESYLRYNLFSWMRADYRTEAGGKVTAFQDKVADGVGARAIDPAHAFAQGTSANQVVAVTTSANFAGREAAVFSGVEWYDSTIPAANWKSGHDGVGLSIWATARRVGAGNMTLLATCRFGGGAPPGMEIIALAGSDSRLTVKDAASGFPLLANAVLTNGCPVNTTCYVHTRYRTADNPDATVARSGGLSVSTDQLLAPSSANPEAPMRIGSRPPTADLPWNGSVAEVMFATNADAALRARVERYLLLRYGLAA